MMFRNIARVQWLGWNYNCKKTEVLNINWNWELVFPIKLKLKLFHREEEAKRNTKPTLVKRKFGKQTTNKHFLLHSIEFVDWTIVLRRVPHEQHAYFLLPRPIKFLICGINNRAIGAGLIRIFKEHQLAKISKKTWNKAETTIDQLCAR